MEFVSCNNFRIRDETITNLKIEEFIKSIKNQYDIDLTSPKWEHGFTRLRAAVNDYIQRIKEHKLRKSLILEKLQKEFTDIPSLYLTDVKARAAKKKERLKPLRNKLDSILPGNIKSISSRSVDPKMKLEEIPEMSISEMAIPYKVDTFLPSLNTMSSQTSNYKMSPVHSEIYKVTTGITSYRPSLPLLNTRIIKRSPKTIEIDSSQNNTIQLKFKNCANHIALIQYHSVTDMNVLKSISVLPATMVKLIPGITYIFKLMFKPMKVNDFASQIKFHVKYPAESITPSESYYKYCVPIIILPIKKTQYRSVTAPETIVIPPIYSWPVKNKSEVYKYPFASSDVSVDTKDTHSYYVRIVKRVVNFVYDDTDKTRASNENNTTTPSVIQTNASNEINTSPSGEQNIEQEIEDSLLNCVTKTTITSDSNIQNEMLQLIDKIVERAMDVFVFDKTYLFLKSGETKLVRVYFIQVLHIGCHNCYYDFKFYDSESNELIFTKTTRVFADVMPHPIQVKPDALYMTDTPILFGHCVKSFVITNTQNRCPVNIKIVTSPKTKKLIKIEPMKTIILQKSSAKFVVRYTSDRNLDKDVHVDKDRLFVVFMLKIFVSSYVSAYKNIKPIYYEIIAYNEQVYRYTNINFCIENKYTEATQNHNK